MISMVLGVLVGYIIHQYGTGSKISYAPAKDFTGKDTLVLNISGNELTQPIYVVKDSASYRRLKDSTEAGTWLVVSNSKGEYIPVALAGVKMVTCAILKKDLRMVPPRSQPFNHSQIRSNY
ncbi:hypothetical protein [Paraflavitalea speifideaquila]|uniref:hypothetical protein n=1 Tax=Paraflavitalea speifideaquila TaxID=3076558 RepID=UPI0028EC8A00|nr:hypothetical protein [Paraflavitalea speifideiaquila]